MIQRNDNIGPPYGTMAILLVGAFIALLNNTLLGIALPAIMLDLEVQAATAQWLSNGYMLIMGVLIPTTAFLMRKFSVRHLFLAGMGLFTIGSTLAGVAPNFSILLVGRMTQAAGAAVMSPLLMNMILVSFPVNKRGTAMGIMGMVMMGGPALGPLLSGFILQYFEWRVLFYIVAPIACLTMVIASFVIRDKKEQTNIKLDITSVIFSSLGFGGILYGFSTAGDDGWNHSEVYITILVGLIALIIFIMRQTKQENPMLNFNVFKFPMYSLSIIISMIISMTLFSSMILIPIYFITLRGISTMDAGLMMLPGVLILSIMSPIVGKLFDKMGARILAVTGLFIITVTSYYFSQLTLETTYFQLIFLNTVRSLGIALVMMPVATNGLNQLPERFYPHGTAMNNTMQQISGAIGTALLITIMSIRTEVHASAFEESLLPVVDDQIIILSMLEGINDAFFVTIFFSVIALILAAFFKRSKPEEEIKKINKVENRGESGLVSSK